MAIDLREMESRLKIMKEKRTFISPGMTISDDEIKSLSRLIKEYGTVYFGNCISSFDRNVKGKVNLLVQITCSKCGVKEYVEMGRGVFIKYIKLPSKVCSKCKKEIEETRKKDDEIRFENSEKDREEKTKEYIEQYLNPNASWKKEVKTHEKWAAICNQYYKHDMIYEHVSDMGYYDYLNTPQWKAITEKKRKQAYYKCQLCNNSGKLSVHHKTYEHKGIEMFHMNDLIVLCDDCHKKFHDIEE